MPKPTNSVTRFTILTLAFLVISLTAFATRSLADDQSVINKVRAYTREHQNWILREFVEFLSIPNVASDAKNIRRNAEFIVAMLRKRGLSARTIEVEGGPPVAYGELNAEDAQRTVSIYAHYDGQPVVPEKWAGEPWVPVLRDKPVEEGGKLIPWEAAEKQLDSSWRLFARSVADDKAPIMAWMAAIDALQAADIPISVNLRFFFEGEEEDGSRHIKSFLEENAATLQGDVLLLCDGPAHQSGRPQFFFGVRGIVGLEMTVYGPIRAAHSGNYGNWVTNPAVLLSELITSMRNYDGNILIDGYYDSVIPPTKSELDAIARIPNLDDDLRIDFGLAVSEANNARLAERVLYPTLNVRGLQSGEVGELAKNAIPAEARASLDFRLVPNQTPEEIKSLVASHLKQKGFLIVQNEPDLSLRLSHPKIIKLEWGEGYPPTRTSMDSPAALRVIRTIEAASGEPLVVIPSLGGSGQLYLFESILKMPMVGISVVNHDNNQHGPNENLKLQSLWTGIETFAVIIAELGKEW